jgi:hypothetical protein
MRKSALGLLAFGILLAVRGTASAEIQTISWSPVTTYTDGTPIIGKTITYSVYWTTDATLRTSLVAIASGVTQSYTTFDPAGQGMIQGRTVYFTMKTSLNSGEVSALSAAHPWVVPAVSPPPSPALSGISISGPASVNEGATGAYTATANWSDGATSGVHPAWSVSDAYAAIDSAGVLTAAAVTANQTVTVNASYTYGGITKTAGRPVTIADVTLHNPASPGNLTIVRQASSSPETWRLAWDPVTRYADGKNLEPGRFVRYDVYWTRDPSLAAGTLIPLASSIPAAYAEFQTQAQGMTTNERIYFTLRATLDAGEQSALSGQLAWRVSNKGPAPPSRGKIVRK